MSQKNKLPFKYENIYRPSFEHYASGSWGLAFGTTLFSSVAYYGVNAVTLSLMAYSGYKAYKWGMEAKYILKMHSKLYKNYLTFKSTEDFKKDSSKVYWGTGFEWGAEHAQRMYQLSLLSKGFTELGFNKYFKKLYGCDEALIRKLKGSPHVHGVEEFNEEPLYSEHDVLDGHVLILGTTGAGKTKFLELMVSQAIWRRQPIIIIDPKGDADLVRRCLTELRKQGREQDFKYFHPAHPSKSVRVDMIANFSRYTEIATRLVSQMSGEGNARSFKDAAWSFINNVVQGMLYVGIKPTIYYIRYYLTSIAELTEKVLIKFLNNKLGKPNNPEAWRDLIPNKEIKGAKNMVLANIVDFIQNKFDISTMDSHVSAMIKMFTHDSAHYSKMTTTLLPLLDQLVVGDLKDLLSPDYADFNDKREIVNTKGIVNQNQVLYMSLDSLSDPAVGSTIGSILLSDAAAVAGERYNYGKEGTPDYINLFVDEASEVVNDKLIQLLNKGRGAGFRIFVAAQNVPDFYSKLGSEDTGRMVLGNANTLVALRVTEAKTQEFCTESFKKVRIKSAQYAMDNKSGSESDPTQWAAGYSERLQDAESELVSTSMLGVLPNFNFLARMADGRVLKGRVPILKD